MKKLYVSVDTTLQVAVVKDNFVVSFLEYDYDESSLDRLYSLVTSVGVDQAVFVVHGYYNDFDVQDAMSICELKIGGVMKSCFVSVDTIEKIYHLIEVTGICNYRIVDKMGYYAALKKNKVCMIDQYGDLAKIVTIVNGVQDVSYTRPQGVEQVLIRNCGSYTINDFIDINSYVESGLTQRWVNIDSITEKRALVALSLFAYTEEPSSNFFELKDDYADEVYPKQ